MLFKAFITQLAILGSFGGAPKSLPEQGSYPHPDQQRDQWVDSVYSTLSTSEKIGQLFMVDAYTVKEKANRESIQSMIDRHKIGGIIFFKGDPQTQAAWTNQFQRSSKIPLFIGIDGEWGLAMRLENTIQFPKQLTLGAVRDNTLIYEMGREIGRECRRIGININFAPDVDVNNNAKNPVIHERSFGEDKFQVALKGLAYAQGMQREGVMACAKHFPGHGDTDSDSHFTLPLINQTAERIKSLELFPFKVLFNNGIMSVMAAHLFVPALDPTPNQASSLSPKILTNLLRDTLGFQGLVFSDALNMKGVAAYNKPGDLELKALRAGNDVLLFSADVNAAINRIQQAVNSGEFSEVELAYHVKKILGAKFDLGPGAFSQVNLLNIDQDLNNKPAQMLRRKLYEAAVTIASNDAALLPFSNYCDAKFASLSIGGPGVSVMQQTLDNYARFDEYYLPKEFKKEQSDKVLADLANYSYVVVGMHEMSRKPETNYGLSDSRIAFIRQLSQRTKVILVLYGTPYSTRFFDYVDPVVVAYEDNDITESAAAQVIFGGMPAQGKLPVTSCDKFKAGNGYIFDDAIRLKYTIPEEVGISAEDLSNIDVICNSAITKGAMPGCQVLVAKEGKVIYNKAFGYFTYGKTREVKITDIYDIASCTKVVAPTLAAMYMYESGKLDLNKTVKDYLELPANNTIGNIKIRDLLLHEAGLTPFIPFYKKTIESDAIRSATYRYQPTPGFMLPVATNLYIRNDYPELIWNTICTTEVSSVHRFVYSDLSMYIMRRIIDKLSKQEFDQFLNSVFYSSMGLQRLTFKPAEKFNIADIPPTENDQLFRAQQIQGYVHDPGAAMMGGVSGHAGVFANANDLAALMQMLLNGGDYAGIQFLNKATIDLFTKRQSATSRRGYGFDKPEPDKEKVSPCSSETPLSAFGHTGFTGTCVWADPDNQLIYVFLSNRVYTNADNWKIVSLGVRSDIQSTIYKALLNAGKQH